MSCQHPATLRLSLEALTSHGGETGPHRDGWGVAFYLGNDLLRYRDQSCAAESPLVRFVAHHSHKSRIALAHLRLATQGLRSVANTQPFTRELGGVMHCFAHNGKLAPEPMVSQGSHFRCIGETDSERAFCELLHRLTPLWRCGPSEPPAVADRLRIFAELCAELRELGPANILYSDGDALFVHADRRTQASGVIEPPGLWSLQRECVCDEIGPCAGAALSGEVRAQHVTLFASVPLSDEAWVPMARGEVAVARFGQSERRRF
jgi:glutamine amidotransferase